MTNPPTDEPSVVAEAYDPKVHAEAVDLLGRLVNTLGSHHPLTEHVRLFADLPIKTTVLNDHDVVAADGTTPSPYNFEVLPAMLANAYAQAVEAGWNYQVKIKSETPGVPALMLAFIQPESVEDWVGLLDEGTKIVEDPDYVYDDGSAAGEHEPAAATADRTTSDYHEALRRVRKTCDLTVREWSEGGVSIVTVDEIIDAIDGKVTSRVRDALLVEDQGCD